MSSKQSIHELLRRRSARFSFSLIAVIVFLFCVLQSILLFYEHQTTREFIENWLGKTQDRIEQSLFLENSLGVQGILGEVEGLKDQSLSVRILRAEGSVAGMSPRMKVEQCFPKEMEASFHGFFPRFAIRSLCFRGPLRFAEKQLGWIEISADYNFGSLARNTLISLVLCIIVLLVVRRSATLVLGEVNQSVMQPLSVVSKQMSAQHTEIRLLSPIQRDSPEFRNAPIEVLNLIDNYNRLITMIQSLSVKEAQRIELLSYAQIADQVSHDIRSPLAALNVVLKSLKDLPEDMRLILRGSAQRITDIAYGLQKLNKSARESSADRRDQSLIRTNELPSSTMLSALVDSLVSEKRIQFRELPEMEIQAELDLSYGIFVNISGTELARVLSNLINNSVEAQGQKGKVLVVIRPESESAIIEVIDQGRGIPPEMMDRLGQRGATFGKEGVGSGLGLYHAFQIIEGAGGKIQVISQVNVGTMIRLSIPRISSPSWFGNELRVPPGAQFISIDDDQTIHQIWAGRLSSARASERGVSHLSFTGIEVFERWVGQNQKNLGYFLVDYEFLGQGLNGLDLIERNHLQTRSILVTSRYEEPHIRNRAERLGVKILPKSLAPIVPFVFQSE